MKGPNQALLAPGVRKMTTTAGLLVAVASLILGWSWLLQSFKAKPGFSWPKALMALVLVILLLFIVWLAIMALLVGPALRGR